MRKEIEELAVSLGIRDWNRLKWRQRGAVPRKWRLDIIEAARKQGIRLTAADMEWKVAAPKRRRAA